MQTSGRGNKCNNNNNNYQPEVGKDKEDVGRERRFFSASDFPYGETFHANHIGAIHVVKPLVILCAGVCKSVSEKKRMRWDKVKQTGTLIVRRAVIHKVEPDNPPSIVAKTDFAKYTYVFSPILPDVHTCASFKALASSSFP